MTKELLNLYRLDELKNFAANILLKLVCQSRTWIRVSVTYLEPCIERRDYHYITSPIVYWSKGSIVSWYKIL